MTTYLLAGGGTAGHVNPLLAVADQLRSQDPSSTILVLGTAEGLEARLVPARGYELLTIPRLPFPRRLNQDALKFFPRFRTTVTRVAELIAEHRVDVVVGFGGYASAPAYLAARRTKVPLVIHEANAKPGLANKLGARYTKFVGVAFAGTPLRGARFVGMPLRHEIETLEVENSRAEGFRTLGLDPTLPTLLVTGGSLGARRINATIVESAQDVVDAGYQILHIQGARSEITDPDIPNYHIIDYCDRMDLALAVADIAVSRAGAATVAELTALGIPAIYVPYPVGNGEQRFNAQGVIRAGGGVLVDDAQFVPDWVSTTLLPLLRDRPRLVRMADRAKSVGVLDGSARVAALIKESLGPNGSDPGTSNSAA